MKSIASSIDHEKQNEKNQLNDQNQVGSLCHEKHLKQMSEYSTNQRNSSRISVDQKLIIFKELINEGLLHICVVCQRCFYKKFVFFYDENKFKSQISNFNLVRSFNSNLHICRTCCIKCQKGKVLCQAVSNKLEVFDLPVEFQSIWKLEKVLITKCLLFKKDTIMPSVFQSVCQVYAKNIWNNM